MTLLELVGMLLGITGFALICVSLGANITWRLAALPRRAVVTPAWVWLVAMIGMWLTAAGLTVFEQWLPAASMTAVGFVFGIDAIASAKASRGGQR